MLKEILTSLYLVRIPKTTLLHIQKAYLWYYYIQHFSRYFLEPGDPAYSESSIATMPLLRPRIKVPYAPLRRANTRSSSKNTTQTITAAKTGSGAGRADDPTKSNTKLSAIDEIGTLIEGSSGMYWERMWLKDETEGGRGENGEETENAEGQERQHDSHKAIQENGPHQQNMESKESRSDDVLKAEAKAKADEEWEKSRGGR